MTMQDVIKSDPTLDFFLNKVKLDYDKLDWQLHIQKCMFLLALNKYLDKKYI